MQSSRISNSFIQKQLNLFDFLTSRMPSINYKVVLVMQSQVIFKYAAQLQVTVMMSSILSP